MNRLAIKFIEWYQKYFSLQILGGGKCKFYPTCSQYAKSAYEKYGFFKATVKSLYRILRCNPFGKGGYDPLQ